MCSAKYRGLQPRRQHSGFVKAFAERGHKTRRSIGRAASGESDHRYRLLRVPCERPRGRRTAEQRYELAASHAPSGSQTARMDRCTINLSKIGRKVLGTNLNRSEASGALPCVLRAPGDRSGAATSPKANCASGSSSELRQVFMAGPPRVDRGDHLLTATGEIGLAAQWAWVRRIGAQRM